MATYQITVSDVTTIVGVTEAVTVISTQVTGIQGPGGQGVPVGGTTNQVLAKVSATNYDTQWVNAGGGGGSGTVTSVGTGTGLTGGPITTAGTISLADISPTPAGTFGSATAVPAITVDIKGRTTAVTSTPIQLASAAAVTGLTTTLGNKANTNSTNTFTGNQTINGEIIVNGNLYAQGPSAPQYFKYDALTGDLDLTSGSILTTGNVGGGTGVFSNINATQVRVITDISTSLYARFLGTFTGLRTITVPDKDITIAGAGANTDITSLAGLTTALSTAQGGTGSTTATGTGSNVLATSPTITGAVNNLGFSTQATPATQNWTGGVTATLAVGTINNRIFNIRSTDVTGAATLTLPAAALINTNVLTGANNTAIDFSIVNASASTVTVALVTGITAVGSLVINATSSAQFRIYKVSTTAMVLIRLS